MERYKASGQVWYGIRSFFYQKQQKIALSVLPKAADNSSLRTNTRQLGMTQEASINYSCRFYFGPSPYTTECFQKNSTVPEQNSRFWGSKIGIFRIPIICQRKLPHWAVSTYWQVKWLILQVILCNWLILEIIPGSAHDRIFMIESLLPSEGRLLTPGQCAIVGK